MAWIVDVDLVSMEAAAFPDAVVLTFDVTYPGETWCRSVVYVGRDVAFASEQELASSVRDGLLGILERETRPASVELRLSAEGLAVLALAYC